jgi:phage-related holin
MYGILHDRGLVEVIKNIFTSISDYLSIKLLASAGITVYTIFFGNIPYNVASAVVILVIMDMITGIMASKQSGAIITSKRAFASAGKIAVYGLLISAGHLTEVVIGFDMKVDESIMIILSVTELISILENGAVLGYSIPQKLLNRLKEFSQTQ